MSEKLKHRWCQFTLRTLLITVTLLGGMLGFVAGFNRHQQFCRSRTDHHIEKVFTLISLLSSHEPRFSTLKEREEAELKVKDYVRLVQAWDRAQWRPWERLWIDEMLPEATGS